MRRAYSIGVLALTVLLLLGVNVVFLGYLQDRADRRQCAALRAELDVYAEYTDRLTAAGTAMVRAKQELYRQLHCRPERR